MKKLVGLLLAILLTTVTLTPAMAAVTSAFCPELDGGEMKHAEWEIRRELLDYEFLPGDDGATYLHLYYEVLMGVGYQCTVNSSHRDLSYTYIRNLEVIQFSGY